MVKVQDALDAATQTILDKIAPERDLPSISMDEIPGKSHLINQKDRGQSLLSRSAEPRQRKSLFRR